MRDDMQSYEPKNSDSTPSDLPTTAINSFCHQTPSTNLFSHYIKNQELSNAPDKTPSLKVVHDTIQQEHTEIEMKISDNLEVQKFGLSQGINSAFSSMQSFSNASNESNSLESMGKKTMSQNDLTKSNNSEQLQMPGKNDISQLPTQSTIGPKDSDILSKIQREEKNSTNEPGLYKIPVDQCGIKAIGDEKLHGCVVQPLSLKPASKTEMKLNSNIFGQANLSVSSSYPSLNVLMERKFLWDQNPNETKSFSTKSSDEPFKHSSQTSILSQNPKDTTSSEVHYVSGNENTKISTTETESSKALTRISNTQKSRKRNKYAPKVLPRNPLFRNLALTSQIKDEEIIASLPVGCDDIEREQFFALYRLRALNQAMGKLFLGLPITSDPQIVLDFYTEERHNILSNCASLCRKPKRKLSYGESDNYLSKKKRF
ncbi:putative ran-binding protein [Erysiphe neolycopersici]|uniref:Putative ran-binding protein n=1 Tax=Erysiphe neolycopersici TaxID=212602 RepID=A0A420I2A5_9PEZI|nr:putative ran-binding protein [Erysiphe neolycopersici]